MLKTFSLNCKIILAEIKYDNYKIVFATYSKFILYFPQKVKKKATYILNYLQTCFL